MVHHFRFVCIQLSNLKMGSKLFVGTKWHKLQLYATSACSTEAQRRTGNRHTHTVAAWIPKAHTTSHDVYIYATNITYNDASQFRSQKNFARLMIAIVAKHTWHIKRHQRYKGNGKRKTGAHLPVFAYQVEYETVVKWYGAEQEMKPKTMEEQKKRRRWNAVKSQRKCLFPFLLPLSSFIAPLECAEMRTIV